MAAASAAVGRTRRPVFDSPGPIILSAVAAALLVGGLLTQEIQFGVAVLAGCLLLPVALLNLPLAIALWVPLVYFEAWAPARFVPWGVGILLGLAWLGTLGGRATLAATVARRHRTIFTLVALFLCWIAVSLLWATDPGVGAKDLWVWGMAAAILAVIATTISTARQLRVVLGAFVVAGLLSVAIALPGLSSSVAPGEEATRLGASFQNPNYLAAGLLTSAILGAGLAAVTRRASWRLALCGAVVLIGAAILTTGSRGGIVAALVAGLAALIVMRGSRLRLGMIIAGLAVGGMLWVTAASDSSVERLREFDTGGSGRIDLWSVAWRMSTDHPVIGVGFGNYPVEAPDYISRPGQLERVEFIVETPKEVHNAYLGLVAETGVIGLALFLIIIAGLVRITLDAARRFEQRGDHDLTTIARTIAIAQIAGLAALFFAENPANHQLWILLGLGPVLVTIAERSPMSPP
jgi:O-antigen ligase